MEVPIYSYGACSGYGPEVAGFRSTVMRRVSI
jgi:hypothetical protein